MLALALPPALLFRMYSTLNQSLGKPLLVTWLQALSLLVKVPVTMTFLVILFSFIVDSLSWSEFTRCPRRIGSGREVGHLSLRPLGARTGNRDHTEPDLGKR